MTRSTGARLCPLLPSMVLGASFLFPMLPAPVFAQTPAPAAGAQMEDEESAPVPDASSPRAPRTGPKPQKEKGKKAAGGEATEEMARLFRARQVLGLMGVRYLALEGASGSGGSSTGVTASSASYRGQVTAPSLAFLSGLSDRSGGPPPFRSPVFVTLEGPGRILLAVDISGEIRGPGGEKTGIVVYDRSRLPETVEMIQRAW